MKKIIVGGPIRDDDFDIIAEKTRVMEMYDREYAGVDGFGNRLSNKKRRKITNYTKPKNRKKKK